MALLVRGQRGWLVLEEEIILFLQRSQVGNEHDDVYQKKHSYWENVENPFTSDADIIDHQNALIEYPNNVTFSFHTSINVPDEQRRFCIIGV